MPISAQQWRVTTGVINASKQIRPNSINPSRSSLDFSRLLDSAKGLSWDHTTVTRVLVLVCVPLLKRIYTVVVAAFMLYLARKGSERTSGFANGLYWIAIGLLVDVPNTLLCVHDSTKRVNRLTMVGVASSVVMAMLLLLAGDVERNPGPPPTLDVKTLVNELSTAKEKYSEIGIQLGIEMSQIRTIEIDHPTVDRRLSEILKFWLDGNTDILVCWESIINVLVKVDKKSLATHLREKCCVPDKEPQSERCASMAQVTTVHVSQTAKNIEHSALSIPPLEHSILNEDQQRRSNKLRIKMEDLNTKFQELFDGISTSLEERNVQVSKIVAKIRTFQLFEPVSAHGDSRSILEDRISDLRSAITIDEVMSIILEYSSFFNYHLVERIIKSLGTDEDCKRLAEYEEDYKVFAEHTVYECPSKFHKAADTQLQTVFLVKVDDSFERCTISHLKLFVNKLSKVLELSEGVLLFESIRRGCIELTFQVPQFVHQSIFPLSPFQESGLAALGVIKISAGDYRYEPGPSEKDNESSRPHYIPASEIAANSDPRLMENVVVEKPHQKIQSRQNSGSLSVNADLQPESFDLPYFHTSGVVAASQPYTQGARKQEPLPYWRATTQYNIVGGMKRESGEYFPGKEAKESGMQRVLTTDADQDILGFTVSPDSLSGATSLRHGVLQYKKAKLKRVRRKRSKTDRGGMSARSLHRFFQSKRVKRMYNYTSVTSGRQQRYCCTIDYLMDGKKKSVDSDGFYQTKGKAKEHAAKRVLDREAKGDALEFTETQVHDSESPPIGSSRECLRHFFRTRKLSPNYNYVSISSGDQTQYCCTISYFMDGKTERIESGGYYPSKAEAKERAAQRVLDKEAKDTLKYTGDIRHFMDGKRGSFLSGKYTLSSRDKEKQIAAQGGHTLRDPLEFPVVQGTGLGAPPIIGSNNRQHLNYFFQTKKVNPQYDYVSVNTGGQPRYRCTIKYVMDGKTERVDSDGYYLSKGEAKEHAAKRVLAKAAIKEEVTVSGPHVQRTTGLEESVSAPYSSFPLMSTKTTVASRPPTKRLLEHCIKNKLHSFIDEIPIEGLANTEQRFQFKATLKTSGGEQVAEAIGEVKRSRKEAGNSAIESLLHKLGV